MRGFCYGKENTVYTVYFTIPTDGKHHHPTMPEILASDALNAGMLENVTEDGLYSWHDIETPEDVQRVLRYIAENIGNYDCDIEQESDDPFDGAQTWTPYEKMIEQKANPQRILETTSVCIIIDQGTHIDEVYHPAKHIPDFFDQCDVLEIINEETGEILYRDQEIPEDPYMPYISETLMDFLKEVEFI